jgi:hypothetical protein
MNKGWRSDLEEWLVPFLGALGHMCPAYVAGLIGSGDRKSIQPMAARDGQVGYDQLHHFIAGGVWNAAPLEKVLLAEADKMVGSDAAWQARRSISAATARTADRSSSSRVTAKRKIESSHSSTARETSR